MEEDEGTKSGSFLKEEKFVRGLLYEGVSNSPKTSASDSLARLFAVMDGPRGGCDPLLDVAAPSTFSRKELNRRVDDSTPPSDSEEGGAKPGANATFLPDVFDFCCLF